jgi:hypothetical protein
MGQRIAAVVPGARLAAIDDMTYAPVAGLIEAFVSEGEARKPPTGAREAPQGAFRAVLFKDLVGHTEMMSLARRASAPSSVRSQF